MERQSLPPSKAVEQTDIKNESYLVEVCLDSEHRFEENSEAFPFWMLPHDEYGFNHFDGELRDGFLWYAGQKVVKWSDLEENAWKKIRHEDEEAIYDYYMFFVTEQKFGENGVHCWRRGPLIFDGQPIIDSHVCLSVYKYGPKTSSSTTESDSV